MNHDGRKGAEGEEPLSEECDRSPKFFPEGLPERNRSKHLRIKATIFSVFVRIHCWSKEGKEGEGKGKVKGRGFEVTAVLHGKVKLGQRCQNLVVLVTLESMLERLNQG